MDWPRIALGSIGGILAAVFGPISAVLAGLLALLFLDLGSALIANGRRHNLDPLTGYLGWRRKANTLLLVLALAVAQAIGARAGIADLPAAQAVAGGFAVIEVLSVIRNLTLVGGRLPVEIGGLFKPSDSDASASDRRGPAPG